MKNCSHWFETGKWSGTGTWTRPIVSCCSGLVPCTCPSHVSVQCEQAFTVRGETCANMCERTWRTEWLNRCRSDSRNISKLHDWIETFYFLRICLFGNWIRGTFFSPGEVSYDVKRHPESSKITQRAFVTLFGRHSNLNSSRTHRYWFQNPEGKHSGFP